MEKRALLVAAGTDLAPNFVWKTVNFPNAQTGFTYSIVLQILLSESRHMVELRMVELISSRLDHTDSLSASQRRSKGA